MYANPGAEFSIGVHAAKHKYAEELLVSWPSSVERAFGEVYLWGEIEEHKKGWLAEFAYPKNLQFHPDTDPTVILALEELYGVPGRILEPGEAAGRFK